jgi:outer membrane protein
MGLRDVALRIAHCPRGVTRHAWPAVAFALAAPWLSPALGDDVPADTLHLTLADAVLMALDNNPDLLIQRLEPSVAETYAAEQQAAFDPVLTASATRSKTETRRFLGSQPEPFELTTETKQYDVGISEGLPTGTTVSVGASVGGTTSSIYEPQYSGNVALTVTQSLLRGFGFGANLASLRRARLDVAISRAELKGLAESVLANTEQAYWALYLAAEGFRIQQGSLDLANRQLEESLERVQVGRLPEVELASVRAEVAVRQSAVINAQSSYEQALLNLLYLLNPPEQPSLATVVVPESKPAITPDSLEDVSVHEEIALRLRPDLEQARLAYEQGKLTVAQTRNGLLPRLDFFITLGRTSYGAAFSDALPDIGSPFHSISGGLSLDLSIPERAERAQARRAQVTEEQLRLSLQNMDRLVRKDVHSAYIEVLRTRQQIDATRVTRQLQQTNLEAEVEKFRVGRSTNLLVLQVQRDFTASQLDEVRALVDHLNALDQFHLAEGTLLERRGIEVPAQM